MLRIKLHIFPLILFASFVAAIVLLNINWIGSIAFLLIAALFMNFSLHITVHHFVHFKFQEKWINVFFELFYTIILGLPFSFYKMQHFNHHRYNNLIGDFTSTWKRKDKEIVPRKFFGYCFFWFLNSRAKDAIHQAKEEGDLTQKGLSKIRLESILLLLVYAVLILLNPWYAIAYVTLIYVGWCLIAMTNYGQHLPMVYDSTIAYSYHKKTYNWLLFNNGLHFEHHYNPRIDYPDLKAGEKSGISWPHLLISFLHDKNDEKTQ